MYSIPFGMLLGSQEAITGASLGIEAPNAAGLVRNLVPVTIGNILGGTLLVAERSTPAFARRTPVTLEPTAAAP